MFVLTDKFEFCNFAVVMNNVKAINTDKAHIVPTILAGYYKFGSQTLLLGDYGTTGGGGNGGI